MQILLRSRWFQFFDVFGTFVVLRWFFRIYFQRRSKWIDARMRPKFLKNILTSKFTPAICYCIVIYLWNIPYDDCTISTAWHDIFAARTVFACDHTRSMTRTHSQLNALLIVPQLKRSSFDFIICHQKKIQFLTLINWSLPAEANISPVLFSDKQLIDPLSLP